MLQRLKHYALIAVAGFLLWGIMANHFILEGRHIHLLRKTELNLHDTFISLHNKKPAVLLKNERLREAGIGELLVDLGLLTEDERYSLESKFRYGE